MQTKKSLLSAALALALSAGAAQAATVSATFFSGTQQLSDNSAESINTDLNGNGLLDVGDTLRGIFTVETVEQAPNPTRNLGGASGNNELNGIFEIEVVTKVAAGGGLFTYTFKPTAAFEAIYGAGAMAAFYEEAAGGNPNPYTRLTTPGVCTSDAVGGNCETNITAQGTLFWVMGFSGAGGTVLGNESWSALGPDDVAGLGSGSTATGGFYNLSLSQLLGGTGPLLGLVACGTGGNNVELCGTGNLLAKGTSVSPYESFDNVDFTINVAVPEPASLALLGIGLLGLGGVARRRHA